jgi:hypothetical protein
VQWDPVAENQLARTWLQASDPLAITRAQARIDQRLADDPLREGRFRSEGLYRIDEAPLACTFTVDAKNRIVRVRSAGLIV